MKLSMHLFLVVALFVYTCASLKCDPPAELPQCVVCKTCTDPFPPYQAQLTATVENDTARIFSDGDGKTAHRFATFTSVGNKTHVELKVTPDAPDKYRYYTIGVMPPKGTQSEGEFNLMDIRLDGNMKGNGAGCQLDLDQALTQVDDGVTVIELNDFPADRCK